jgi:hypothetical protein
MMKKAPAKTCRTCGNPAPALFAMEGGGFLCTECMMISAAEARALERAEKEMVKLRDSGGKLS